MKLSDTYYSTDDTTGTAATPEAVGTVWKRANEAYSLADSKQTPIEGTAGYYFAKIWGAPNYGFFIAGVSCPYSGTATNTLAFLATVRVENSSGTDKYRATTYLCTLVMRGPNGGSSTSTPYCYSHPLNPTGGIVDMTSSWKLACATADDGTDYTVGVYFVPEAYTTSRAYVSLDVVPLSSATFSGVTTTWGMQPITLTDWNNLKSGASYSYFHAADIASIGTKNAVDTKTSKILCQDIFCRTSANYADIWYLNMDRLVVGTPYRFHFVLADMAGELRLNNKGSSAFTLYGTSESDGYKTISTSGYYTISVRRSNKGFGYTSTLYRASSTAFYLVTGY